MVIIRNSFVTRHAPLVQPRLGKKCAAAKPARALATTPQQTLVPQSLRATYCRLAGKRAQAPMTLTATWQ